MTTQVDNSSIYAAFLSRTPNSARLSAQAQQVFPSGVTHDARFLDPYPIYVERSAGARKWDIDGHEYVDYSGGHGALLLGHNHPEVVQAVRAQLGRGSHFGAGHELEVRWGEIVKRLIRSAERVRFTSSGTEATMLAMRLARAYTARSKILRFAGHFHGWHDHAAFGVGSHFDGTPTPGVVDGIAHEVALAPSGDLGTTETLLKRGDVAAVIIEPTGASWGKIPLPEGFITALRELTEKYGSVLIFDEVISGFRCAPGGAQGYYGVVPDLTTLAKILAGGLPGGALAGRRDIMDGLSFTSRAFGIDKQSPDEVLKEKVSHHGTFNANPISAAAGIKTLEIVEDGDACHRASSFAQRLREEMNRVLIDSGINWCVYGSFSGFHIFTNPDAMQISSSEIEAARFDHRVLKSPDERRINKLRLAMLVNGVELFAWPGGPTSAVHTEDDLELTVEAFRRSLRMLKEDGDL